MCVSTRGQRRFPSVLLKPLGHLSAFRINELWVVEIHYLRNCVRPPYVLRIW